MTPAKTACSSRTYRAITSTPTFPPTATTAGQVANPHLPRTSAHSQAAAPGQQPLRAPLELAAKCHSAQLWAVSGVGGTRATGTLPILGFLEEDKGPGPTGAGVGGPAS